MSRATRTPFWRLSVASKHTPPPLIFNARLLIGSWSNFSWSTILYVIWKSLRSRGNLLLQNIIVSFSRGYYSSAPLPEQTSCQISQAAADRFCPCIAAYCQRLRHRRPCQESDVTSQSVDGACGDVFTATRLRTVPATGRPHRLR